MLSSFKDPLVYTTKESNAYRFYAVSFVTIKRNRRGQLEQSTLTSGEQRDPGDPIFRILRAATTLVLSANGSVGTRFSSFTRVLALLAHGFMDLFK